MFAVKLPGRESRAKEPFFQNMQQIVDEVVGVLLPELKEKPFALFGHRWNASTATLNCVIDIVIAFYAVVVQIFPLLLNNSRIIHTSSSVLVLAPSPVLLWQILWKNSTILNQFIFSCLVPLHLTWVHVSHHHTVSFYTLGKLSAKLKISKLTLVWP